MKGEIFEAIKERKNLFEKTAVGKRVVMERSKEIEDAKAKVEQLQTTFEQSKVDFDKALVQKANALEDLTALHERTEKVKTAQLETAAKALEAISAEVTKLVDQSKLCTCDPAIEAIIDRNILQHPKSRKKEILAL